MSKTAPPPADAGKTTDAGELSTDKGADNKPAEGAATPPTSTGKSEFEARFEQFVTEFGADAGTKYLKAGLNYEQALKADLEATKLSLKAAEEGRQATEQKLAAVNLGETTAIDTGTAAGEGNEKVTFSSCFKAAQGKKLKT